MRNWDHLIQNRQSLLSYSRSDVDVEVLIAKLVFFT